MTFIEVNDGESPERHNYVKPFSSNPGQTDGRTDGQNCYINIARQCADAR